MIRAIASALLIAASCTSAPRVSPSPEAPSPVAATTSASTPAPATPTPLPTPPDADRYGVVIGTTIRSEASPRSLAELAVTPFNGAVSPDGRRLAYWETLQGGGEARVLHVFDIAAPTQDRILLTLPTMETADVSTGGGVVWSSDGNGLLIGVRSVAATTGVPVGASRPIYTALWDIDATSGAMREVARLTASLPLRPVAWDRRSGVAAAVGTGDGGYTGSYVVARERSAPTVTPFCCNIAPALGAPDASRALAVSFEPRALFIWPLADLDKRTTMAAAPGERIDRALWRNAREIVVLLWSDAPGAGPRLEVWSLDGRRRVVIAGVRDLSGLRADGSAAIVGGEVIDLDSGTRWQIPGVAGSSRVVATLLLR